MNNLIRHLFRCMVMITCIDAALCQDGENAINDGFTDKEMEEIINRPQSPEEIAEAEKVIAQYWKEQSEFANEQWYPIDKVMDTTEGKTVIKSGEVGFDFYNLSPTPLRYKNATIPGSTSASWVIVRAENFMRKVYNVPYNDGKDINAYRRKISGTVSFVVWSNLSKSPMSKSMRMELPMYVREFGFKHYRRGDKACFRPMPEIIHAWFAHQGSGLFAIDNADIAQWTSPSATCVNRIPSARLYALLPEINDQTAGRILKILNATTPAQVAPLLKTMSQQDPLERMAIANRAMHTGDPAQAASAIMNLWQAIEDKADDDFSSFLWEKYLADMRPSEYPGGKPDKELKAIWRIQLEKHLHSASVSSAATPESQQKY